MLKIHSMEVARRLLRWIALATLGMSLTGQVVVAQQSQLLFPRGAAEEIRSTLFQVQLRFGDSSAELRAALDALQEHYRTALSPLIAESDPQAHARIQSGFSLAAQALAQGDQVGLAIARAQIWTAILSGGYRVTVSLLESGDPAQAQHWLTVREFRHATRFSRPNADATQAIRAVIQNHAPVTDAIAAVHADLLDTYQGRLNEALSTVRTADARGFTVQRAEAAALAEGYFAILAPAYAAQRGEAALQAAQTLFATLRRSAQSGGDIAQALTAIEQTMRGFRAAPLSPTEQRRRSNQMLRFLKLVPIEYGRGVRNGQVTIDLEITEAATFHAGAAAAFADLRALLDQRDPAATERISQQLDELGRVLAATSRRSEIADPSKVDDLTSALLSDLTSLLPLEWQQQDSRADFDVIRAALDQMEQAIRRGEYELAELARLDAYAVMEAGPEVKLIAFAPQYKLIIEGYFWQGHGDYDGLAALIRRRASAQEIARTRAALDQTLTEAERAISGNNAPISLAANAAIIVFREGLEAVVILASLMGSLKVGAQRRFRIPIWIGVAVAFVATVCTWLIAQGALMAMARLGEILEAIVSLIAVAVLLLITNWFFHNVYWTDWMAAFHQQKKRILAGSAGQWLGLITLGFTSIYREGFETVLFLQALVLEGDTLAVAVGIATGLLATVMIGLAVFVLQAKLPHKKMLIVTGILIGAVLLQMVGKTVSVMQVLGWLPLNPIRWLELPYWTGFWFGLYPTWEGIGLQIAAAAFVIGSYYFAEYLQRQRRASSVANLASAKKR
jgi:high-affinity iron transporter